MSCIGVSPKQFYIVTVLCPFYHVKICLFVSITHPSLNFDHDRLAGYSDFSADASIQ